MAIYAEELLVKLGFEADTQGAKEFSENLRNISVIAKKVDTALTKIESTALVQVFNQIANAANKVQKSLNKIDDPRYRAALNEITHAARDTGTALDQIDMPNLTNSEKKAGTFRKVWDNVLGFIHDKLLLLGSALLLVFNPIKFVETASQFEQLELQLSSLMGSAAKGQSAFSWIQDFAENNAAKIADVTQAFKTLYSEGINPQKGLLQTLTDASAGLGIGLNDAAQAVSEAINGNADQLKDALKIDSKQNKNGTTTYSYRSTKDNSEQSLTVKTGDKKAIEKTIKTILDNNFAGASAKFAKTWEGSQLRLGNIWTDIQKSVMDNGVFNQLKIKLNEFINWVDTNRDQIINFFTAIANGILIVINIISLLVGGFSQLYDFISNHAGLIGGLALIAFAPWIAQMVATSAKAVLEAAKMSAAWIMSAGRMWVAFYQTFIRITAQFGVMAARSLFAAAVSVAGWIASAAVMVATWVMAGISMFIAMLPVIAVPALIILAVVALVAIIWWLYNNWQNVWGFIQFLATSVVDVLTAKWNEFTAFFTGMGESIKNIWNTVVSWISEKFAAAIPDWLKNLLGSGAKLALNITGAVPAMTGAMANGDPMRTRGPANTNQTVNNQVTINTPTPAAAGAAAREFNNNSARNTYRNSINGGLRQ